jgi:hypothetical protein
MRTVIKFEHIELWTDDTGILYCTFLNNNTNYNFDLSRAQLYKKAIITLCAGKAMPFLYDLRNTRGTFTISAANFLAKNLQLVNLRISEAFVTNTLGMQLLIATYKRLYDPITPFAIFKDLQLAKDFCIETKK